jgi:outer membrane protein assembly factor BamB
MAFCRHAALHPSYRMLCFIDGSLSIPYHPTSCRARQCVRTRSAAMDVRPLLRLVAIAMLVLAGALGVRARRRWPARHATGVVAGTLAVLALAGFALSALDLLAPRAPVPDSLSVYYTEGGTLEAASAATGTVRWRYTPPSPTSSIFPNRLPPFANGVFYVNTDGALRAVRARDGQQLWAAPIAGRAFEQLQPALDQGIVYATSAASVVALRDADGRPLWQTSQGATPGSATSAPQVANGRVYVAFSAAAATVYALDARDGAIRWTHTEAQADAASLTVADGVVYAAFGGRGTGVQPTTVMALGAGDGAVRWTHAVEGDAEPLAVTDGALLLSSQLSGLLALDLASGHLLWQRGDLGLHGDLRASQLPVVANGVVYVSGNLYHENNASRGVVLAMDARTGRERWRTLLEDADVRVSLAGSMLYAGGGYAYALRASDGHVVWRYGTPVLYYQPVLADGAVFIGSTDFPNSDNIHLFGIGSNDFLTALDARTGRLYWRTSADVECMSLLSS